MDSTFISQTFSPKAPTFSERSELAKILVSFKREFLWAGAFSFLINLLLLTPTIYMLQIYDRILAGKSVMTLIFLSAMIVMLYMVMSFTEWLRSRLLVRAGLRLDQKLNSRVFTASFDAYLRRTQMNPTEAFTHLNNLRQFLTSNGIFVFFDLPWTPIFISVVFILHPYLGWLSIFFALIQLCLALWTGRTGESAIEAQIKAERKSKAYLQAKLKNVESIEAMGMLGNLRQRWLQLFNDQQQLSQQSQHQQNHQQVVIKFIRYSMQSLTLGAGALLVIQGELSAGAMVAVNLLMTRALQPLDQALSSWRAFLSAKDAFIQLETVMHEHPERQVIHHKNVPVGAISLRQLSAFAPDKKTPILHHLQLDLSAGKVTCVIGPSGSGKSTLARCLVGIWPDKSGDLLLDDLAIEQWDRDLIGPSIGYLPQDVELLEGTIAENISRFYDLNPDLVIEAAKKSGVHEMVLRLPKGYDTPIGEAGSLLSGGQRQRIALARTLYGNPQIMVLDEPNANLDDAGEKALIAAIQQMKTEGRTVVLVTHRLNILSVADDLLVMQEGKVLQHGPRDEILKQMKTAKENAAAAASKIH